MRESCKSSGASKARGSGTGEVVARGNPDRGWRCGGDDGADKWGPHGGDRGKGVAAGLRKLEEEAASGNYAKAKQAGMGRARVRGPREEGAPGRVAGLKGRTGRLAAGPFWAESEEKILFRIKN
jgi:hypothetical protein